MCKRLRGGQPTKQAMPMSGVQNCSTEFFIENRDKSLDKMEDSSILSNRAIHPKKMNDVWTFRLIKVGIGYGQNQKAINQWEFKN